MKIKNIIYGLTLLGMGGVSGYFIAKKQLRQKYQDDVAEVQDFYYKKLQELGVMEEGFEPEEPTDEEILEEFRRVQYLAGSDFDGDEINTMYIVNNLAVTMRKNKHDKKKTETSKDAKFERSKGRPIINYNKPPLEKILADIEDQGDEEIDEVDEDMDIDEAYEAEIQARAEDFAQRRYDNQMAGEPYCIDYVEYEDAKEQYETQILYYYAHDRVLCEDDDSIVDDEEIVGLDYEDVLSVQSIAWVKNDRLCMLYEIHSLDASYNNVVANAIETPREREFRLISRRKQALDDK